MAMYPAIKIERVDNLPIILVWLVKMNVAEFIDSIWTPHGNWQGLSYGKVAVLFITYVIQSRTHNLSKMEKWLEEHHNVLEGVTGWTLREKEVTDDRIGILLENLGQDEEAMYKLQEKLSKHQIQAFKLPTKVARYDTTSFSVHHEPSKPGEEVHELLRFGHSKDHRPDLLQFKQGLGTLDPAGVPIFTDTISGESADDGLYIPAWKAMAEAIGSPQFLFVCDCKAAAMETRATIQQKEGWYLFPLPLTGDMPEWLQKQVLSQKALPILLKEVKDKDGNPKEYGQGFVVEVERSHQLADGTDVTWTEQCFVTQSKTHAYRQRQGLQARLARTRKSLDSLCAKSDEDVAAFKQRAAQILKRHHVTAFFTLAVTEMVSKKKRYLKAGRPGPHTPYEFETVRKLQLHYHALDESIDLALHMAGWRVYVTNASAGEMSLEQAVLFYRDEWQVEHGMHRFKKGALPVIPLSIRLPDRIRGLMLLLFIALQALTLIEFVARRALQQQNSSLSGLIPGNPHRTLERPSAERLLAAFDPLHLIVATTASTHCCFLNETLTPLQIRILDLLGLSVDIYLFHDPPLSTPFSFSPSPPRSIIYAFQ
jgi:transposase